MIGCLSTNRNRKGLEGSLRLCVEVLSGVCSTREGGETGARLSKQLLRDEKVVAAAPTWRAAPVITVRKACLWAAKVILHYSAPVRGRHRDGSGVAEHLAITNS